MNSRNQSLDVLRGIAVLLVIMCHYPLFAWMKAGWFGVDLFFVLSGFLISGLLFSDLKNYGKINLLRFYFRRGMKIYPGLFFFLALTAVLWPNLRQHLWVEVLFLQNYLLPVVKEWPQHGWTQLWSLAVEEHFYIALPLLLIGLNYFRRLAWIPKIAGSLIGFCFIERMVRAVYHPPQWLMLFRTHERIDSLFAGVALGYLFHFHSARFQNMSRPWLLPAGLICISPAVMFPVFGVIPGIGPLSGMLMLNLIGFSMILTFAVMRSLRFSPLQFIGRYSYSIYLWHTVPMVYFLALPVTSLHFIENVAIALVLGIATALLVEMPALRLRDAWLPDLVQRKPKDRRIAASQRVECQVV